MTAPPDLEALLGSLRAFAIPMTTRFRGITVRGGALIRGPAGWGEFSPFAEYGPRESARWLASALEAATAGWPAPVRDRVPVNVTVPAVPAARAHEIAAVIRLPDGQGQGRRTSPGGAAMAKCSSRIFNHSVIAGSSSIASTRFLRLILITERM